MTIAMNVWAKFALVVRVFSFVSIRSFTEAVRHWESYFCGTGPRWHRPSALLVDYHWHRRCFSRPAPEAMFLLESFLPTILGLLCRYINGRLEDASGTLSTLEKVN